MTQPTDRWMRWLMRRFSLAMLFALSIAVLNLLPQCSLASEKPARDADTPKKAEAERPPFDLTYLHPKAMGVIAIRPSAIFSDPAMKPLSDMANEVLAQFRQVLKVSEEAKLSIEDIEEIVGHIMIYTGDKKQGRNHSLVAGLGMIRATHDFDWITLIRQLDPKTEEVRHGERVYYRSHFSALGSPDATFCYFMPDKRTVAFLQEKTLSMFVNGESIQRPHFPWDKDWKHVEHGLIAVAMDNRWASGLSKEQIGGEPNWDSLAQNAATVVAGVDWKDGVDFHAYLIGKDRAASEQIVKDIKAMLAQLQDETEEQPPKGVSERERQATAFNVQMWKDLVEHARIQLCESTVRVHTTAKISLTDFAKYFFVKQTFTPK